jgi:hypothetical protein
MAIRATSLATAAILALGSVAAPSAQAGYVVTLEEVGSDVVATGSGALDLIGLTAGSSGATVAAMIPRLSFINTGPTGFMVSMSYKGISGPSSFGSGEGGQPSSGSGDIVGLDKTSNNLLVPRGYISDSALADTSIYDNQTFASLGVTPGVYEWTWGTGADQNFTLDIGASPVPEPSTWTMLLIGFAGLGYASHRASRKSAALAA